MPEPPITVRTLSDGGQRANAIADRLEPWLGAALHARLRAALEAGARRRQRDYDVAPVRVGDATKRAWFSPGHRSELLHRIAKRIGAARRRVRIASPVLTAGPILGTLNQVISEGRVDVCGICDAAQVRQVFQQWAGNPRSRWKTPLLERAR